MPSYNQLVGLDTAHRRARDDALKALQPGVDVCPRCSWPMWPTAAAAVRAGQPAWCGQLDLGDWPGRIFGGPQVKRLEHARCNRTAGAALGNRLRALGITRPIRRPRSPAATARRRRAARW